MILQKPLVRVMELLRVYDKRGRIYCRFKPRQC